MTIIIADADSASILKRFTDSGHNTIIPRIGESLVLPESGLSPIVWKVRDIEYVYGISTLLEVKILVEEAI